jgi:tetratricopeptide (TPR) repeat protein
MRTQTAGGSRRFIIVRQISSFNAVLAAAGVFMMLTGCASRPEPPPVEEPAPAEEPVLSTEETLLEANGYLEGGRVGEAAKLYEEVLKQDPDNFEANLGTGIALLTMEEARFQNQRDYAVIRPHLEAARDARPEDPRPYVYLGTISYAEKNHPAAIRHLSAAAGLDPGDAGVHELLGLSLVEAGRTGEAKTEFHRALSIDPSLANANLELGKIYERAGSNEKARAYLEKALVEDPNLHLAAYYLQRVYYGAKLYDLAESKCRRFLEFYPDDIQSLEILGNIYRLEDRGEDMFKVYTRLTRIEPGNTSYWSPVIQYLTDGKAYEAAREILEEALTHNPYYAYGNVHYGKVLLHFGEESAKTGNRKQARQLYSQAREHLERALVDDRYEATAIKLIEAVDRRMDALSRSP